MACKRCGQCCVNLHFILGGIQSDDDKLEMQRFVALHGCEVYRVQEDGHPDVMGVKVPLNCRHLQYDGNSGHCSCAIYENRPEICRGHLCNAAKEK